MLDGVVIDDAGVFNERFRRHWPHRRWESGAIRGKSQALIGILLSTNRERLITRQADEPRQTRAGRVGTTTGCSVLMLESWPLIEGGAVVLGLCGRAAAHGR
jgi:hypothetical protein